MSGSSEAFAESVRREVPASTWDDLVDDSGEAWLWHRHAYADALATWPDAEDCSFGLVDGDGRLVAVVPLLAYPHRRARGRLRYSYLRSVGGPAVAAGLDDRARHAVRTAAVETLIAAADRLSAISLEVVLSPLTPAYRLERSPRVNPLVELGFENTLTQTWVIDLRPGEDAIASRLKDRVRGELRKAERGGVVVRPATEPDAVDAYYALHLATYRRTGASPHPRAYFERIWTTMAASGLAVPFFAEIDGTAVAARTYASYKNAALYWTGADSPAGRGAGAGAAIHWHAIRHFAEGGFDAFESGEAFPGSDDPKERGLTLHKAGFGGELYPFYKGRLRFARTGNDVLSALAGLRSALRARGAA